MNKALAKNPVGRPLAYKTVAELQLAINDYFDECDNRVKIFYDKDGGAIDGTVPEPYTMSGLAYALGIDRRTLLDYSNRDQFLPTIKAAKNRVQRDVERRLMETSNQAGAIFNLKNNFGWRDHDQDNISIQMTNVIMMPAKLSDGYDTNQKHLET